MGFYIISINPFTEPKIISDDLCLRLQFGVAIWGEAYKELFDS